MLKPPEWFYEYLEYLNWLNNNKEKSIWFHNTKDNFIWRVTVEKVPIWDATWKTYAAVIVYEPCRESNIIWKDIKPIINSTPNWQNYLYNLTKAKVWPQ